MSWHENRLIWHMYVWVFTPVWLYDESHVNIWSMKSCSAMKLREVLKTRKTRGGNENRAAWKKGEMKYEPEEWKHLQAGTLIMEKDGNEKRSVSDRETGCEWWNVEQNHHWEVQARKERWMRMSGGELVLSINPDVLHILSAVERTLLNPRWSSHLHRVILDIQQCRVQHFSPKSWKILHLLHLCVREDTNSDSETLSHQQRLKDVKHIEGS